MSTQTAVDKFHDAVNDMIARRRPMTSNEAAKIWAECKEVEKSQIKKAYEFGTGDAYNYNDDEGEQYYNETYGNEK